MILEIQHETRLEYTDPVSEWMAELRMEPLSDRDQTCQSFALALSQTAPISRFQDGFGNRVHHFNLLAPAQAVRILAASIVETHPSSTGPADGNAVHPLDPESHPLEVQDYVRLRGPVAATPRLGPVLESLRPARGAPLESWVRSVSAYIHSHFTYARDVTNAASPIHHLLEEGKGVCQDFAHLMIAIARSFGVPARYVSGYLHRPDKDSQSHAWCEVWLPDRGWFGIDPTNDCLANDRFVKVAFGRDFSDVPPNKGIYRGQSGETIFVRVETRELERLPSLSWQEQLPPLHVPLVTIRQSGRRAMGVQEEAQQQ